MNPEEFRGTDVSYSFICNRRLWFSLHGDVITDGSEFIYEGKHLEDFRKKRGYVQIKIGRNRLDSVEIRDGLSIIHEFKRGRRVILPDIMQVSHYINAYQQHTGRRAIGIIHLSSRKTETVELTESLRNMLIETYGKIIAHSNMTAPPPPVKNGYCFRGCSLVELCWGEV